MNDKLSKEEYLLLRDAIEELWSIKDDIKSVKQILGFKGESQIDERIQEIRTMIRKVAEGELRDE